MLRIESPAEWQRELPDPLAAWAWAHAQVSVESSGSPQPDSIRNLITSQPGQTLSRLICPRVLTPFTAYLACVVPTFESGRLSGLGLPGEPQDSQQLSWDFDPDASTAVVLQLPVYHHWRFTTGEGTDFESVARRIRPCRLLDSAVGGQLVHIGAPGFATGASENLAVLTSGALQPAGTAPTQWPGADADAMAWQSALARLLQSSAQANTPTAAPGTEEIGPPMHGEAYAPPGRSPEWLDELNLDPRLRIAAGLGVRLVQQHQEEWVAQAWAQQGELQRANQLLGLHQLARWTVQHSASPTGRALAGHGCPCCACWPHWAAGCGWTALVSAWTLRWPPPRCHRHGWAPSMVRLTAPRGLVQRRIDRVWLQSQRTGLLKDRETAAPGRTAA